MKTLAHDFDLDAYFERVRLASQRALLLDYDGTLAPFRIERDEAIPYPGVRELIDTIQAAENCRIVMISGRSARELASLAGFRIMPEIWGSHGVERLLPDGKLTLAPMGSAEKAGLSRALEHVKTNNLSNLCEVKPASLALHVRGHDSAYAESVMTATRDSWSTIAKESGLSVHEFDGGIELRLAGIDKGRAVNTILKEMGPDVAAAYLGDDLTDEDAFIAIQGRGLGVLVREELRPTAAGLWLRPPEELLTFLKKWHTVSGGAK